MLTCLRRFSQAQNRVMARHVILFLLAGTSILQLSDGIKLWNSKKPKLDKLWRAGWNIDLSTYRGQESVTAEQNPDGSSGGVNAISLAPGSNGLSTFGSGAEFYSAPLAPRECLTLSYNVWFEDGFDFAYGGKLPGLYGGGVNCTSGTDPGKDCFTSRFIWKTGGKGGLDVFAQAAQTQAFCDSGDVECNQEWGHRLASGSFQFENGRWYTLQQTVRLNTPGQDDGYIRLNVGGIGKVYETRNILLRDSDIMVDGIFFSSYFGETSPCSASSVDTHIYFRAFVLKDNFC